MIEFQLYSPPPPKKNDSYNVNFYTLRVSFDTAFSFFVYDFLYRMTKYFLHKFLFYIETWYDKNK